MKILALGNKARQGKDLFANYLSTRGFKVYHFADPLKEECRKYFNWGKEKNISAQHALCAAFPNKRYAVDVGGVNFYWGKVCHLEGWLFKDNNGQSWRVPEFSLLQFWGSIRREQDKDYWVKKTFESIFKSGCEKIVIADLRHQNEAEWIKILGGKLIKLKRVNNGTQFIDSERDPSHISETDLDNYKFDYELQLPEVTNTDFLVSYYQNFLKDLI